MLRKVGVFRPLRLGLPSHLIVEAVLPLVLAGAIVFVVGAAHDGTASR